MMRHGFIMLETVIYIGLATLLMYITFSHISRFIAPLKDVRIQAQSESVIMAVIAQIVRDGTALNPDQFVECTENRCIWKEGDAHRGWVFEKDTLYYCTGTFEPSRHAWKNVRRQAILTYIKGNFNLYKKDASGVRAYAIAIRSGMCHYEQIITVRNGLVT
jgi:hypothetical protein